MTTTTLSRDREIYKILSSSFPSAGLSILFHVIIRRWFFFFFFLVFVVGSDILGTRVGDKLVQDLKDHGRPEQDQEVQPNHQAQNDILYKVREPVSFQRRQLEFRHVQIRLRHRRPDHTAIQVHTSVHPRHEHQHKRRIANHARNCIIQQLGQLSRKVK